MQRYYFSMKLPNFSLKEKDTYSSNDKRNYKFIYFGALA